MGPGQLEAATQALADTYAADLTVIRGEELLDQGYPLIHAVGRAADQPRACSTSPGGRPIIPR